MNRIYKSVFNVHTGTWVAVQETAKSQGKKSRSLKAGVITAGATVALLSIVMTSPDAEANYVLDGAMSAGSPTGIACASAGTSTTYTCQVPGATGGFATISVNASDAKAAVSAAKTWATSNLKGIALGDSQTSATGSNSLAVGVGANSSASSGVALGSNASVTQAGGVALGQGSVANTAAGATGYVPTGASAAQTAAVTATKSTLAAISVGSAGNTRQITNVAAGTTDTDAVNVAQLKAITAGVATHYYSVNDGGATQANYNNDGATGRDSLAAGVGASSTAQNAVSVGVRSVASGNESIVMGYESVASGERSQAYGFEAEATGYSAIALGEGSLANKEASVALGAKSTTATDATTEASATLNGLTYGTFAGQVTDPGMQVSVGSVGAERQIKNVGSGAISATSTDAINGSQLYATNSVLGNVSNSVTNILGGNAALAANGTITMTNIGGTGKNNINDAIAAVETTVTPGTNIVVTPTTNANGSTNYEVATSLTPTFTTVNTTNLNTTGVTNLGGTTNITGDAYYTGPITNGDNIVNKTYVDNTVNVLAETPLTFAGDTGTNVDRKLGETLNIVGGNTGTLTDGNIGIEGNGTDTLTVKLASDLAGLNSISIVGGPTINSNGINMGGDKITNLAAGDVSSTSTDAVNGSQLYTVQQLASKGHNVTTAATGTGTVSGTSTTNVAPGDTVTYTAGNNIAVTQNGKEIQIATSLTPTFTSVSVTNGPIISSSGIDMGGDKITNVAAGTAATDAVNVSQLTTAVAAAKTEVAAGTNIANVTSSKGTNGQTIYTVNADGTTVSAAGSGALTVVKTVPDANNVTDYTVDLSQDTKDTIDGALQEVVTQIDGTTVKTINKTDNTANFVTGKNIKLADDGKGGIQVATADDVTFNNLIVTNETQLGDNFVVNNGGVYYDGPITEGNHIVNKDYVDNSINVLADTPLNFAGNTGDVLAKKLGETLTISGELAEGEDATGANLRVDSADGKLNLVMAKNLTDLNSIVINGGPTINNTGINMNNTKITNLTAGDVSSTSTDAVNGSQLYEVSSVANKGWNIATDSGTASNVKPGDTVNMKGDGSIVVSNTGNDVTVGLADVVIVGKGDTAVTIDGEKGSVTVGDTTINSDGLTIVGGPSVTKNGINAGDKQITDVASGLGGQKLEDVTGDDLNNAVNVGDLQTVVQDINTDINAAKSKVEAGKNVTVSSVSGPDGTVYTVATKDEVDFNKVTVGGLTIDKGNVDGAGNTIISGVGAGKISSTSTDAVNGSQLYATNQKVTQNTTDITNINTTLDKGLNFSADSGSTVNRQLGDTVAITGDGNVTTTTTANGVQVGLSNNLNLNNVTVNQSFSVAEGATVNMGGNVIQNVAPGVNGTDAVNVNQLNAVAGNVAGLQSDMRKAYGGVAAAMSLEAAPYIPGTTTFAIGTGYFQKESAFGISLRRTADNGRWSLSGGATVSRGGVGARLAITGILYDER